MMEAYVENVRKMEKHFDGLQVEHVPRAENCIADHLSKCAAQKLPVEPGTFVLHLTQPSVSLSTMSKKRRKLNSGKHFPAELPEAAGREAAGENPVPVDEQLPPAGPPGLAVETSAPVDVEMPLVLVVEPQAPTWAQHIVHFLQTGELPEEQEEDERVARRSSMYQFVDDTLYRR